MTFYCPSVTIGILYSCPNDPKSSLQYPARQTVELTPTPVLHKWIREFDRINTREMQSGETNLSALIGLIYLSIVIILLEYAIC